MEKKLEKLFDYQNFEQNKDLQQVIRSVHARTARRELDPFEMDLVAAAGNPEMQMLRKERKPEK